MKRNRISLLFNIMMASERKKESAIKEKERKENFLKKQEEAVKRQPEKQEELELER